MHKKTWGGDLERIIVQDTNQCCCCALATPPVSPLPNLLLLLLHRLSPSRTQFPLCTVWSLMRSEELESERAGKRGSWPNREEGRRRCWTGSTGTLLQPGAKCYRQAHKTGLLVVKCSISRRAVPRSCHWGPSAWKAKTERHNREARIDGESEKNARIIWFHLLSGKLWFSAHYFDVILFLGKMMSRRADAKRV